MWPWPDERRLVRSLGAQHLLVRFLVGFHGHGERAALPYFRIDKLRLCSRPSASGRKTRFVYDGANHLEKRIDSFEAAGLEVARADATSGPPMADLRPPRCKKRNMCVEKRGHAGSPPAAATR
jgi:hypothetical protein